MKKLIRILIAVIFLFVLVVGGIIFLFIRNSELIPFNLQQKNSLKAIVIETEASVTLSVVEPTATEEIFHKGVFVSNDIPDLFHQSLLLTDMFVLTETLEDVTIRFEIGNQNPVAYWTYAFVLPYPSLLREVAFSEFLQFWEIGQSTGVFYRPILMTEETLVAMTAWLGIPAEGAFEIASEEQLLDLAWSSLDQFGLIPLEKIEPKWKVIYMDGQHPLHGGFDESRYGLRIPISLQAVSVDVDILLEEGDLSFMKTNFERSHMTNVLLTGVTALVRATAWTMEQQGVLHPGEDLADFMKTADVTHISNEVPFAENCPYPDSFQKSLIFCSDTRYYDLLTSVGMDVVELTGDHFNDWGAEAMLYTLDLYNSHGIPYYGGGLNNEDGMKPYTFEHNQNQIAFIGCNGKGLHSATDTYPGAVKCDYEFLADEIARLKEVGYLVIFTFQHNEIYQFEPSNALMNDFRFVLDAGATIVSGSQAHVPHGIELFSDSIITYGLGNLFFDQYTTYEWGGEAVLAQHTIYQNKYINTELLPIVFVDYAKPVFASEQQGRLLLEYMYRASFWK